MSTFATDGVEIRLRAPAPLDRPLAVVAAEGRRLELTCEGSVIASATPAEIDLDVPASPSFEAATHAAAAWRGGAGHPSPGCFVCGPKNEAGLRLTPGPLTHAGRDCVATPWCPDASLAGTRDWVRPEFLWAALDCPGYYAAVPDVRWMLLASLGGRVEGSVRVGERCVVVGWRLGGAGRKHRAATALYGADGRCVARAAALWIETDLVP